MKGCFTAALFYRRIISMDYTSLRARPITGNDEKDLEAKLEKLAEATNKSPHIISIYPKGSRVIAWVMIDLRDYSKVEKPNELEAIQKSSKKKVRKKKVS